MTPYRIRLNLTETPNAKSGKDWDKPKCYLMISRLRRIAVPRSEIFFACFKINFTFKTNRIKSKFHKTVNCNIYMSVINRKRFSGT